MTAWWRELRAAWARLRALRRLEKRIDRGNPHEGLSDEEVLYRARTALAHARQYPEGSAAHTMATVIFDLAVAELEARFGGKGAGW